MIWYYFTKTLQVKMFEYFREIVIGFDLKSTYGKQVNLSNFKCTMKM